MRLALVIRSSYEENTVVARRDAFLDNAALFAERFGSMDAEFEVMTLDATRDLPESLEELLRSRAGRIESLLVHFTGYIAVKADRGPALLLDGSRLRAFPLSRLRAAIEDGAQQSLVIFDGLAVVDADQSPEVVAKSVGESIASPSGSIAALVGIEDEPAPARRGPQRLTDLFVVAVDHLATKARGGLVSDNAVYQAMQSDAMSFGDIPGVIHHAGYFDFVLLQGPNVEGVTGHHRVSHERTTQPVAVFPGQPAAGPSVSSPATATAGLPGAHPVNRPGPVEELPRYPDEDDEQADSSTPVTPPIAEESARAHAESSGAETPVAHGSTGERRFPTLAETPRARAGQRDWISEAAYFPSAPPPPVTAVKPALSRPPQATLPGIAEAGAEPPPSSPGAEEPEETVASRPSSPSLPDQGESVIALYEDLLARLDATFDPRRAEVQTKLGDALRDAQRHAEALFAYERALDVDPLQSEAFAGACELYGQARDYAGLVSTIRRRLESTDDQNERLGLLDQVIEIWMTEGASPRLAIEALEERLSETPEDVGSLQQLIEAQDRLGDVLGRLDSRERLAKSPETEPELRAAAWVEAATLAYDNLDDLTRTFSLLEASVGTGVLLSHALSRAEALLGSKERWLEVIELSELALETAQYEAEAIQVATRLVTLITERSCQDAIKPASLASIVQLAQRDAYLAEISIGLIESVTQGPETLELLQRVRVALPHQVPLLHRLVQLSAKEHPDVATNVASVLTTLGEASEAEVELANTLSSDTLPTPARALEHADYDSFLFPPELDREMTMGLARLEKALMAALAFDKKNPNAVPKDAPVIDPETSTITLARSFLWTSRLLSVKTPELVLLPDPPELFRFLAQPEPRLLVSRSLGSGFSLPELVYLVARHSALQLPGFLSREHCPDPRALGSLLYALGVVSDGRKHGVKSLADSEQKLGKRLLSQLEADPSLDLDVDRVVGAETPNIEDCEQRAADWLRAVDQVRLRAALLACGTPAIALTLNQKYPLESLWGEEDQLDLLAAFAGSPEHCELRSRLEIAAERTSNFSI